MKHTALIPVFISSMLLFNIATGQQVQQKTPVLYYEYHARVKDTLYLKSADTWLPINNAHEKLFKCFVTDNVLIYVEYMVGRNPENGEITDYIPIPSADKDTLQYYYFPKQIYKQGNEYYQLEAGLNDENKSIFLTALQTQAEQNATLPSQIVFPPYAWLGGGFEKISDAYLHATLTKIEHNVYQWDKNQLEAIEQQFKTISPTQMHIKTHHIETALVKTKPKQ